MIEIARDREVGQTESQRALEMRVPAQREQLVAIAVQHRAPCGFLHVEIHRRAAGDADGFAMRCRLDAAVCGGFTATAVGFDLPVGGVDVAVGERPGDVGVAAHHDGGQAGQGEAGDIDLAARRARVGVAQARAEPEAGRAQAQMHVVGDDGPTVCSQRTRDREIVAAGHDVVGRDVVPLARWRRQLAQVDLIGGRQRRVAARGAVERCVPAAAVVREQVVQRGRQVRLDLPHRQFAMIAGVLQIEIHRETGERGVAQFPGLRLLS